MPTPARTLLVAALLLLPACGGDEPFTPTEENVAGSYQATTLTSTTGNVIVDLLDLGATLTMTLNADGTTEGRLFGPGLGEQGEDVDVDLAGTWALTGSTVTFDQQGDTFVRDVPFLADRNRLTAQGTFVGTTVRVVLTRQEQP